MQSAAVGGASRKETSGVSGTILEVTPSGEAVWEYICRATEPMPSGLGIAPGRSPVFRAYRYGVDYAGLAGKDLRPGG